MTHVLSRCILACISGLIGVAFFLPERAVAQQNAIICLADGVKISASRFETRDGKFFLYVTGSRAPLEYPAAAVKGINVDPCPNARAAGTVPAPSAQPQVKAAAFPAGPSHFGIHGSNTIGERLMPMLIEAYSKQKLGGAPNSKILRPEEQEFILPSSAGSSFSIDLQAHGSGTAAKSLAEGKAVIGMASRPLNAEEVKLIEDKHYVDARSSGHEHVLALDGLAVIVNPANPVRELTLEQIASIFSGQISNWKDVGGLNQPIVVLRRDDKSGTYDSFKNIVLAPLKREISRDALRFESSEALSEQVLRDESAIGFVALPYVNKNTPLAIASSCGISHWPSKFSIKTEEYPLSRRLFLYSVGDLEDPIARELLQFSLSDDAQPIIQEADFVEQAISFQDADDQSKWLDAHSADSLAKSAPPAIVEEFRRLASATRRSSVALRFREGSADLDNKALQDVARLARYLQGILGAGRRAYFVGFADSNGTWNRNRELAFQRAAHVAREVEKLGVRLPKDALRSYSVLAPSACNDTPAGAAKNRRVEVWVEK
jgi:phosphate transport system substrate-binding protein